MRIGRFRRYRPAVAVQSLTIWIIYVEMATFATVRVAQNSLLAGDRIDIGSAAIHRIRRFRDEPLALRVAVDFFRCFVGQFRG